MHESPTFRTRDLPRWDVPGSLYFITSCLHNSIPAQGLLDIRRFEKDQQARQVPAGVSPGEWQRTQWKRVFARVDHWLDHEPTVRHLDDPALASIVWNTLLHFAEDRYDVFALVVMPSH